MKQKQRETQMADEMHTRVPSKHNEGLINVFKEIKMLREINNNTLTRNDEFLLWAMLKRAELGLAFNFK